MNDNNENPFQILREDQNSKELSPDSLDGTIEERIKKILASDDIVLFMKGNENFPQCGFSANTVAILKHLNKTFTTFDILQDMDIRQGLKEYSNWPTYPQLYFKGELLGGNDIITEMFQSGELDKALQGT